MDGKFIQISNYWPTNNVKKPRGVIFKNEKLVIPKFMIYIAKQNTNHVIQLKPGVCPRNKYKSQ